MRKEENEKKKRLQRKMQNGNFFVDFFETEMEKEENFCI